MVTSRVLNRMLVMFLFNDICIVSMFINGMKPILGGGFKYIFYFLYHFTPFPWGGDPI